MDKNKIVQYLVGIYMILLPIIPDGFRIKGIPVGGDLILAFSIVIFTSLLITEVRTTKRVLYDIRKTGINYLELSMVMLFIVMLLSVLYATDKKIAITETLRFFTYIILYVMIKYGFEEQESIDKLFKAYFFVVALLSCIGILQFFTKIGLDPKFVEIYSLGSVVKIPATFGNPNAYAAFLTLSFFPLLMVTLYQRKHSSGFLYGAITFLCFVNLALTFSRNAMLAFVIGGFLLTIVYNWKFIFLLGGGGIIAALIPAVRERVLQFGDLYQNIERILLLKTGLKMIEEHPLFGVGNGNFASLYEDYVTRYPDLAWYRFQGKYPSHNSYLKIWSELGILGIIAFIAMLSIMVFRIRKFIFLTESAFYKKLYTGVLVSIVAFLVMSFFDNLLFTPKVAAYFWIFIAIAENAHLKIKSTGI